MSTPMPLSPASPRFLAILAGVILLLGLTLRLPGLNLSLWVDEAGSLAQASAPNFWAAARHDVHPPLYYLLLRGELGLTTSIPLLRVSSLVCVLALAVGAMCAFRFSRAGALTAGCVAAFSPELLHHSIQLRPYALLSFCLAAGLLLAIRVARGETSRWPPFVLAAVLLLAASTHLATLFFLVALVPLLGWPARREGLVILLTRLWPLMPALGLLLWFKFAFITQPHDLPEGWWVAPLDLRSFGAAFSDASGWQNIVGLGQAFARRMTVPVWLLPAFATCLALISLTAAWRPRIDATSWLLLASALTYWSALTAYSLAFESIVLARTLLPGWLVFLAWLAWGIGHQPNPFWRRAAVAATLGYTVLAVAMPVRQMQHPASDGLRGLASRLHSNHRPGDLVIAIRGLDLGLLPYWPELSASPLLRLDPTRPLPMQLQQLDEQINRLPAGGRIWLVYRDDFYSRRDHVTREIIETKIGRNRGDFRDDWRAEDLVIRVAEPAAPAR